MKMCKITFLVWFILTFTNAVFSQNKINCIEKEQKVVGNEDPVIIKTCTFKNYKSIKTGEADYKGRYSYSYKLFKMVNGKSLPISNAQLFNDKKGQLLSIINTKIEAFYNDISKSPENADCLPGLEYIMPYSFEKLNISFDNEVIEFSYSFDLSSACMSLDGDIISFKIAEIEPYLAK